MPVICILLVDYGMAKAQGDSFQHHLGNWRCPQQVCTAHLFRMPVMFHYDSLSSFLMHRKWSILKSYWYNESWLRKLQTSGKKAETSATHLKMESASEPTDPATKPRWKTNLEQYSFTWGISHMRYFLPMSIWLSQCTNLFGGATVKCSVDIQVA